MSLRAHTVYTVNIGGGTGTAIPLKGGAQPFTTEEDSNEDMFTPIRTQSGYIRIVDDGYALDGTTAFDWKDLIPATDTSRPVTLTHEENNTTIIDWQGYMQAQNFGSDLYGNPQEREFPIQCPLTILEGTNINYTQKGIQNFAYLLLQCINAIPNLTFDRIIMHGLDSWDWLRKRIDWQNFVEIDNDGTLNPKYNLFECLEAMCTFWGWTARTHGNNLYFTHTYDPDECEDYISMTLAQLQATANGTEYGSGSGVPAAITLPGNIFASRDNKLFQQRGYGHAYVNVNINKGDEDLVDIDTDDFEEQASGEGWGSLHIGSKKNYRYTNDLLTYETTLMSGSCVSGSASFNIGRYYSKEDASSYEEANVVRIKQAAGSTPIAQFETVYEHCFSQNHLEFHGEGYDQDNGRFIIHVYVRIGIGKTRATAKWLTSLNNMTWTWGDTPTSIEMSSSANSDLLEFWSNNVWTSGVNVPAGLAGLLFIDIMGYDSSTIDSTVDLGDLCVKMKHGPIAIDNDPDTHTSSYAKDAATTRKYSANNSSTFSDEWNADCVFASDNRTLFGYGLLMSPNANGGQYMGQVQHGSEDIYQEQYMANAVTSYWEKARTMAAIELRSNEAVNSFVIGKITPLHTLIIDSLLMYPIAISREWRDDKLRLSLLEIPSAS